MAEQGQSPWNVVRAQPRGAPLSTSAAPDAGPSITHQLTATRQHSSIPLPHRRAADASVRVSLARVRPLHKAGSAKPGKGQQSQGRIERWVTGGVEQIETSHGACKKVPVVMAAWVTEGRTWQWYRDHLGQGGGDVAGRWQGLWGRAHRAY